MRTQADPNFNFRASGAPAAARLGAPLGAPAWGPRSGGEAEVRFEA